MEPLERDRLEALIRRATRRLSPPLTPEIVIWGADDYAEIWSATEETLASEALPPPFWAFAWAGGQALARHLLDNPHLAAGRRVLAIAAGGGVEAIAAAKAGASAVIANDVDPAAQVAVEMNAALNGVAVETSVADYLAGAPLPQADLILVGDAFYEKTMAEALEPILRAAAAQGALVLLGDPDRLYLPRSGLEPMARYRVPTPMALEDVAERHVVIYRMLP